MAKKSSRISSQSAFAYAGVPLNKSILFWILFVVLAAALIGIAVYAKQSKSGKSMSADGTVQCKGNVPEDRDGAPGDYKNSYCDIGQETCVDVYYQDDCSDNYVVRSEQSCDEDTVCRLDLSDIRCFTHQHCGSGTKDKTKWVCAGGSERNCEIGTCAGVAEGVTENEIVPDNEVCQEKGYAIGESIP